ncbi:hypothetical protein [Vibrio parahaemolyticus]|uniref:hypothetical protein n=1 Tax=Vibrio parahaemolyticus TaxID=670 RepID=UPI00084BBFB6|nr:hypothetical protein [Vibrio parahaemolyticus]ODX70630.1 hypothetical protein BBM09_00075 [Vibrio parahaemolyticus]
MNNQSPYMVESAYNYLRAAKVLWREPNLGTVAIVNAAIGLEILLKSFIAEPVENSRKGTESEQYEINGKRLHKLTDLAKQIDPDIYQSLRLQRHERWFERFDNLFVEARYPYEPSSRAGYSEVPISIGIEILNDVINWYKYSGSPDSWIVNYPSVPGGGL